MITQKLSALQNMVGNVFEIQHFSLHDGPGIRSTVFLKGCPLKCLWCHNPEGQAKCKTAMLEDKRCVICGKCKQICQQHCHVIENNKHKFYSTKCTGCGDCVEACPTGAMHWVGRQMSVQEVLDQVLKDYAYFRESGGGITLSGGEPTLQPEFSLALLKAAGRQGLHRTVETCGYAPQEVFTQLIGETDLFLFDCKETDPVKHRAFVGVDPEQILRNLYYLHDNGANIILRCPIIPGCNDRADHMDALGQLCVSLPNLCGVELLPYHSLGVSKAEHLGIKQREFEIPGKDQMKKWNEALLHRGIKVVAI